MYALTAVHNYIRLHTTEEEEKNWYREGDTEEAEGEELSIPVQEQRHSRMDKRRDEIAAKMWKDYEEYTGLIEMN